MADLYLIAHKVRGEPAFDVAQHQICPECQSYTSVTGTEVEGRKPQEECGGCDGDGFTWVIPTSGHRAYPYYHIGLNEIEFEGNGNYSLLQEFSRMPDPWPDHYPPRSSPDKPSTKSLLEELGLAKPKGHPIGVITRRL